MKTGTFCEKHWKWKAHLKSEKHTWKVRSTWKVKSIWKAYLKSEKHHEKWKAHEKHAWKVKSTTFHEKWHMLFIMSFRVIMDFTVDFICMISLVNLLTDFTGMEFSVKSIMKLLISVKSCRTSWNLNFSEILVDVIKFVMKPIMKYGGISMKFAVKSINDIHSEICNEICNEFNEIL